MILKPAPVSTRQFSYDAATRCFVGEISDTHGFGRVYDDACDEGLTVVGATGAEVVFVVQYVIYDDDSDIRYWRLKSTDGKYWLRLFND